MTQLRGIEADFATWRPVQGRKVLQLIFEVPIEQTEQVLKMLGVPQPGDSKWCAIALLNTNTPSEGPSKTKLLASPDAGGGLVVQAEGGSPKKSWNDYTFAQQSFLLCRDPDFQRYFEAKNEADCIAKLKAQLRIESRSEIATGTEAGTRWLEVVALYNMHRDRHK